jgi:ABC-2 type transport system permease protein
MGDWWQEVRALTRRWYLQLVRERAHLVLTLGQPAFWLVFFGLGVGRLVDRRVVGTGEYTAFILPGVIGFTVIGAAISGAVPLLWDKETGYLHKLLSMPISRGSILLSRLLFQVAVTTVQVAFILVVAAGLGVHTATGPTGSLGILVVAALLTVALTAVFLALAYRGPGHNTFFTVSGFATLPLLLASNAFVPLSAMPPWMAAIARLNPLTYATDASRQLVLDGWHPRLVSYFAGLTLFAVLCVATAYRAFRKQADGRS